MVSVNRATGSFLTCMPKKQNFEVVIVSVNGSTGCSRKGIPELLSRHRVGQQVNRLFSNVYAKICKLSWCRSTGQQAAFERVCQNNKKLKLSSCRSTGQQADFECVRQHFEVVTVSVNGSTGSYRMGIPKLLSRHCVGQQVNRLVSNVYAKICKLSWCQSTGQQAAFERVCQNNKKCKLSLCRSTGQQAVFECVCQNLKFVVSLVNRQFSNGYPRIIKSSSCRSTGQQAVFECV